MALTTKDIIQLLPYTEDFKRDLLEKFDGMDPDQKFNIVEIVWDTYTALYNMKLEENMQLAIQKAADKQETIDKDFYARIKAQTDQEMQKAAGQAETTVDLSDAREELQKIIDQTN